MRSSVLRSREIAISVLSMVNRLDVAANDTLQGNLGKQTDLNPLRSAPGTLLRRGVGNSVLGFPPDKTMKYNRRLADCRRLPR
jgi:hypothetical protein